MEKYAYPFAGCNGSMKGSRPPYTMSSPTRSFTLGRGKNAPRWIHEGIAEYVEGVRTRDNGELLGRVLREGQSFESCLPTTRCDPRMFYPESSRQHAALEVLGSRVVVSDMKSTNGTFVNGEQIDSAELQNHSEFRIGEHVLMLIVTDRE